MATQTLKQLIASTIKTLDAQEREAKRQLHQVDKIFSAECKAKTLGKYKGRYRLNPRRVGKIVPEELKDRELRKEARDVKAKLDSAFESLLLTRQVITNRVASIASIRRVILLNLERLDKWSEEFPQWVGNTSQIAAVLRHRRRNELALAEKVTGISPTVKPSNKTIGTKGDKSMAKSSGTQSIRELLNKLEKSTDQEEKRLIRAQLRKLGHRGGLRGTATSKKKVVKKKTTKKRAKRSVGKKAS